MNEYFKVAYILLEQPETWIFIGVFAVLLLLVVIGTMYED